MSIYNKINNGFSLSTSEPTTAGIEDLIYIFNQDDITLTFDTTNPLIITGLTAVSAAKIYKFEGTNNSFNTTSKLAKTSVSPHIRRRQQLHGKSTLKHKWQHDLIRYLNSNNRSSNKRSRTYPV